MLTIALPKGRVLKQLAPLWEQVGVDTSVLLEDDRTLIREVPGQDIRFLLLKPDDVPTYVEYGAAELGIVGRDVLLERNYDLYAPLDLGIGKCRLAVAGLRGAKIEVPSHRALRVATKFPLLTGKHFARKGVPVETIFVQGSVEIAPHTGLADLIVDLVESGETLRTNGLEERETICEITSVVVANRVGLKLHQEKIRPILRKLQQATS